MSGHPAALTPRALFNFCDYCKWGFFFALRVLISFYCYMKYYKFYLLMTHRICQPAEPIHFRSLSVYLCGFSRWILHLQVGRFLFFHCSCFCLFACFITLTNTCGDSGQSCVIPEVHRMRWMEADHSDKDTLNRLRKFLFSILFFKQFYCNCLFCIIWVEKCIKYSVSNDLFFL